MHSKGIHMRKVNHPILQDGYKVIINLKQRRWRCTNPSCGHEINDAFKFIGKRKRNTNITDFLVLEEFKNLNNSAVDIAKRFNISDTQALTIFDKYVVLDRLPLPEVISIDEVHLETETGSKYALVIFDFLTGEVVDILKSRRQEITEPYFASISKEERMKVEYLIADMYAPYYTYIEKYFLHAIPVVDSFHVVKWVLNLITNRLKKLHKKHKDKDEIKRKELEEKRGHKIKSYKSKETYLLQKHRWVILSNKDNINYKAAKYRIFIDFAYLLERYKDGILNSFITYPCQKRSSNKESRLSNGPIESFNRKPKDLVRTARGYANFDHIRNRLLFSTRTNPPILGTPRPLTDIKNKTGKKRGPYNKTD